MVVPASLTTLKQQVAEVLTNCSEPVFNRCSCWCLLLLPACLPACLPAADVVSLLSSDAASAGSSRLQSHLSPATVGDWLATASRCDLNKLVQICINYIVDQSLPVDMDLLTSLQPSHAN
jgi:hypothetical protein